MRIARIARLHLLDSVFWFLDSRFLFWVWRYVGIREAQGPFDGFEIHGLDIFAVPAFFAMA